MARKTKRRRLTLALVVMATLALAVIYVTVGRQSDQEESRRRPCMGWRVGSSIPTLSNKTENLCHAWLGYPDDEAPWWQWACLVQRYALTLDYECRQPPDRNAQLGGCKDTPWTPHPSNCLVYSFGKGNNLALELFLIKHHNCSVHVFSPQRTLRQSTVGEKLKFHHITLGWTDADELEDTNEGELPGMPSLRMRTLRTIMASLGHEGRSVDMLRLDLGPSTWRVAEYLLQDHALLSTVGQLLLHWSPLVSPSSTILLHAKSHMNTLMSLRERGFLSHQSLCLHDNRIFLHKGRNSFEADCRTSYVNVLLRGL